MYRQTNIGTAKLMLCSYAKAEKPQHKITMEIDCTNLRDAFGQSHFRERTGLDPAIKAWLQEDSHVSNVLTQIKLTIEDIIGQNRSTWLAIGFADSKGTHTAPAMAEIISDWAEARQFIHVVEHAELKRPKAEPVNSAATIMGFTSPAVQQALAAMSHGPLIDETVGRTFLYETT